MGNLQAHLPTLSAECLVVFDQNQKDPRPHPPYSPNLAPNDYFFFPWMKNVLKGERFAHMEEVKQTEKMTSTKRHQNP